MNDQKLLKQLKTLKRVEADPKYRAQSRMHILTSRQLPRPTHAETELLQRIRGIRINIVSPITAGVIGVLAILVIVGIATVQQMSESNIVARADAVNNAIQVSVSNINYALEQNGNISEEIIRETEHVLAQAQAKILEADRLSAEGKVKESIQKLEEAEKLFIQLEEMLGLK